MISSTAVDAVTPDELSRASSLFGTLKQLRLKLGNVDGGVLDKAFELHVQGVLEKLDSRLPSLTDSPLRAVEIVMAKHGLYDAAFQQVVLLCSNISPALGDCVKELRSILAGFLAETQQCFCLVADENAGLLDEVSRGHDEHAQASNDVESLQDMVAKLNEEAEVHKKKILDMRQHLREAAQEINYLREAVSVESKAGIQGPSLAFDHSPAGSGQRQLKGFAGQEDIVALHSPKSQSASGGTGTGRPRGSSGNGSGSGKTSPRYAASLKRFNSTGGLANNSPLHNYLENGSINSSNVRSVSHHGSQGDAPDGDALSAAPSRATSTGGAGGTTAPKNLSLAAPVKWLHIFRQDVQRALDEGRCREITRNECLELIEKLYESKSIANEKALQGIGNVPMETMEQHAFRSMEKKYGLRSLAVEHAGMLLRALDTYAHTDNDVMVFQKIFRNELEEDFRMIQNELTRSIKDLTMVQLMGRYPTKDQAALQNLLEQKMVEGVIIEDDWKDMVNYLYNEADATTLCVLLRRLAIDEKGGPSPGVSFTGLSGASAGPGTGTETSPKIVKTNSFTRVNKSTASYVIGGGTGPGGPAGSSSGTMGYDKRNTRDIKRLGYSSPTLQITAKDPGSKGRKDVLKLSFSVFMRTVLDFQLQSHQIFLDNFVKIFRDIDRDVDGVITAAEFRECFLLVRRQSGWAGPTAQSGDEDQDCDDVDRNGGTEITASVDDTFLGMIQQIDPMETDRVTFSSAVSFLSKL